MTVSPTRFCSRVAGAADLTRAEETLGNCDWDRIVGRLAGLYETGGRPTAEPVDLVAAERDRRRRDATVRRRRTPDA